MSIAVTAVVKPSPLLRALLVCHAVANVGFAMALAWGGAGFHFSAVIGGACLLAALLAWRARAGLEMTRVIDISGLGEIRLTVQQRMGAPPAQPIPVALMPGSTIWPHCLLLLLRAPDGRLSVLAILPDSVTADVFRKVAVAIRTIARRDNKFVGTNKIL